MKQNIPAEKRTRCITYTRVMGYHSPIEKFNIGKIGEHRERKFFSVNKAMEGIKSETC